MLLRPADLPAVGALLPESARTLVALLGAPAACALLNARGGCELRVPRHPDRHPEGARRWAELAEIVGQAGMQALAAHWGGAILALPTCDAARRELRHRAIRAEFDRLTSAAQGLSARAAVYRISQQFAPISSRAVELICKRCDSGHDSTAQFTLF